MSSSYKPELGQILHGSAIEHHEVPEYVQALVWHILSEFERCYWNSMQEESGLLAGGSYNRPGSPSKTYIMDDFELCSYWWGDEDDEVQMARPNLAFQDVRITWYKYPGRGMSVNVEKTPAEWVAWFDAALARVQVAAAENWQEKYPEDEEETFE